MVITSGSMANGKRYAENTMEIQLSPLTASCRCFFRASEEQLGSRRSSAPHDSCAVAPEVVWSAHKLVGRVGRRIPNRRRYCRPPSSCGCGWGGRLIASTGIPKRCYQRVRGQARDGASSGIPSVPSLWLQCGDCMLQPDSCRLQQFPPNKIWLHGYVVLLLCPVLHLIHDPIFDFAIDQVTVFAQLFGATQHGLNGIQIHCLRCGTVTMQRSCTITLRITATRWTFMKT
jgi:hypothetical protein